MPPMRKPQDQPLMEGPVAMWEKLKFPYVIGTENEDVRLELLKWVKTGERGHAWGRTRMHGDANHTLVCTRLPHACTDTVAPPLTGSRHPHLKPVSGACACAQRRRARQQQAASSTLETD
jgi:hypothetical protein